MISKVLKRHLEPVVIAFVLWGNNSPHHSMKADRESWLFPPDRGLSWVSHTRRRNRLGSCAYLEGCSGSGQGPLQGPTQSQTQKTALQGRGMDAKATRTPESWTLPHLRSTPVPDQNNVYRAWSPLTRPTSPHPPAFFFSTVFISPLYQKHSLFCVLSVSPIRTWRPWGGISICYAPCHVPGT